VTVWTEINLLRIGSLGRIFEHGNEHLGSITAQNFLDKLNNNQLFKEDCIDGLVG
jgi:hypothetical protein